MIDIKDEEKEVWLSGQQKNLILEFEDGRMIQNEDIYSESLELEQTLCDEMNLKYGKCSSAMFKVKITDTAVGFKDIWFTAKISCGEYIRKLGRFCVYSDKRTDDRMHREIVAYDNIYIFSFKDCTAWYKNLTFPMTMKNFRDDFFSFVGVEQEEVKLPNDDMQIEKTIDPSEISALTVIESICELNARFGQMNMDGKFRYVDLDYWITQLYPSETLYPNDHLYPKDKTAFTITMDDYAQGSFRYEDYQTQNVTKVIVREQEDDIGGSSGTGDNIYYVTGNFLAYGQLQDDLNGIATRIYEEIKEISYTPSEVKTMGFFPWIETGDWVRVIGVSDAITFPILSRTISGITGIKEVYTASGTETMDENQTSISDQIIQLRGRSNVLTRTVDETRSTITRLEEDTNGKVQTLQTQITQNAEDISLESTRATGAENALSGRISVNAGNISAEVTRATGSESSLSSRIDITEESITSEVTRATSSENSLSSRISQSAHEISLGVSGSVGQGSSAGITISLMDEDGNVIDSGNGQITLDGSVVFKSNLTDGTTTISGNNITTGAVNADLITVGEMDVARLKSGYMKSGSYIYVGQSGDNTYISGSEIRTQEIRGPQGKNLDIYYYRNDGVEEGFTLGNEDGNRGMHVNTDLYAYQPVYFNNYAVFDSSYGLTCHGQAAVNSLAVTNAGSMSGLTVSGTGIYFTNMSGAGSTTTHTVKRNPSNGHLGSGEASSRRYKHDITTDINANLDPQKLYDLPVVQFKYNTDYIWDTLDCRYNTDVVGFIAEEVAQYYPIACDFQYGIPENWNERYIIPPMLKLIQEQHKEIENLKEEISKIKENLYIS